ncbi:ParB/RepB/Spo0J family partition protein [Rhodococcus sp. CH91]|uniref:ParB/RepB/Spo0J family partition protein n=1 Tax=Rhodococcus sp. CH91 TaxID=2910256 RepID=UPI001F4A3C99|nr:ParB/RepB/Spo0J family partition protein [Rhodococcus sp. CH91]
MASKFGVPPEGDKIRSLVTERLAVARQEDGAKVTVDWRGQQKHLNVITMPVGMLYFNPDTHRIRAQRTLDADLNRILDESPWSEDAQHYLHRLLSAKPADPTQLDPDFITLREELDEFGQKEPGIITPDGILVDGNTRCAALRDLSVTNIRVAVLPEDTSRADVNAVELALQLRRDKRRDYSYINRLIAIEDQLADGHAQDDIARTFNIKVSTLKKDRWVFQLINDAIERSRSEDGTAALRLIDFEDHQEKLRELQRDYEKLSKTDPDGAERLKESRLQMVLLNLPKTTLRLAEADFHERYLEGRLKGELVPEVAEPTAVVIPGLTGVTVADAESDVKKVRALTDKLLRAKAILESSGPSTTASEVKSAANLIENAKETFSTAAKLAGQSAQLQKRQIAVPERISDATEHIQQCVREFADAKSKNALDEDAFDDALLTLRDSLARLALQAGRTFESPGDGVNWLLTSTQTR